MTIRMPFAYPGLRMTIAREFQMAVQDRQSLRDAALLHDLGEVAMDRDYIHRAGTLTDEERIDLADIL